MHCQKLNEYRYSRNAQVAVSYVVMITAFSPQLPNAEFAMKRTSVGMITLEHPQHDEHLQYWRTANIYNNGIIYFYEL